MSIEKIQDRLSLINRMRAGGEYLDPQFSERDVLALLAEIKRLQDRETDLTRLCEERFRIMLDLEQRIISLNESWHSAFCDVLARNKS